MLNRLNEILEKKQLSNLFQPIIRMQGAEIVGYEGLIRGPSDSPLHSPINLFKVARENDLTIPIELLCRRITLERFKELGLPGKLFLNVSPERLLQPQIKKGETLNYINEFDIDPSRIIIELTENEPTYDYELLRQAVAHYRDMGFQIAIDDLGAGFSSLRLWSELRPEYVKIDMHFIHDINIDPVKLQFVKSIQEIAEKSGTLVIAEGIETQSELLLIRDLGVVYGQGYHISRPAAVPLTALSIEVTRALAMNGVSLFPMENGNRQNNWTAIKLLQIVPMIAPELITNHVYEIFKKDPSLEIIPVVDKGIPVGVITRAKMLDMFSRLYTRELYGHKPCSEIMDTRPIITDKNTKLQVLSQIIVEADRHHLLNGFIITDQGQYLGMGTGHDLMREITKMQLNAARYANPLTFLPGNVPIDEHIERLLKAVAPFTICYVDLDHFKPFNDVYSYHKGDEVIQLTSRLLVSNVDQERDFVGHIGGDDFIILFQSEDWEARCHTILDNFSTAIPDFYPKDILEKGGYLSEDRKGNPVFHPLICLSLGIVKIEPGQFSSHHQIATAASLAKKQAKKIPGNSIFIERRQ